MPGADSTHAKGAPVSLTGAGEEPVNKLFQVFGKMAQEVNLVMRSLEHMKDAVADATASMRRVAVMSLVMAGPRQHIPFGVRDWLAHTNRGGFGRGGGGGYRPGGPGSPGSGGPSPPVPRPAPTGPSSATAQQVIGGTNPHVRTMDLMQAKTRAMRARSAAAGAAHPSAAAGAPTLPDETARLNEAMARELQVRVEADRQRADELKDLIKNTKGKERQGHRAELRRVRERVRQSQERLGLGDGTVDFALGGSGGSGGSGGALVGPVPPSSPVPARPSGAGKAARFMSLRPDLLENVRVTHNDPGVPAGAQGRHYVDQFGRSNIGLGANAKAGTLPHEMFHAFMAQARLKGVSTGSLGYDAINIMRSQAGLGSLGRVLEEAGAHGAGTGTSGLNFFTSGMAGRYASHYRHKGMYGSAAVAGAGHLAGRGAAAVGGALKSLFEAGRPHVRDFWKDFTHYGRGVLKDRARGRQTGLEAFAGQAGMPFLAGTAAMTGILRAASPDMFDTLFKSVQLMLAKMGPGVIPVAAQASKLAQDAGDFVGTHPRLTKAALVTGGAVLGLTALGLVTSKVVSGFRTLAAVAASATRAVGKAGRWAGDGGAGRFMNSRAGRLTGAVAGGVGGVLAGQLLSSKVSRAFGFEEGGSGDLATMMAVDAGVGALGARVGMRGFKGAGRMAARYGGPAAATVAALDQAAANRDFRKGQFQPNSVGFRDVVGGLGEAITGERMPGETLKQKFRRTIGGSMNRLGLESDSALLAKDLVQGGHPSLVRNAQGELGQTKNPEDVAAHKDFMRKAMLDFMQTRAMEERLGVDEQDYESVRGAFLEATRKAGRTAGKMDGQVGKEFDQFLKDRLAGTDARSKARAAEEKFYGMARSNQTTAQFMTVEDAWRSAMLAGLKDPLEQKLDTENEKNLALALKEMTEAQDKAAEELKAIRENTAGANNKLTP